MPIQMPPSNRQPNDAFATARPACPFHEIPRPLIPVGDDPDDELNRAITLELMALFHDAIHRYAMRLLALEVSPLANPLRGQGQVIALLKQEDGLTTKEMAQLLGIRTASLNELLVKLEAKGLIARSRSDADGRVTVVSLTDEGRAVEQAPFVAEMQAFLGEMGDFYGTLTPEEKQSLAAMLRSIDEAMRRSVPAEATMEDGDAVRANAESSNAGTAEAEISEVTATGARAESVGTEAGAIEAAGGAQASLTATEAQTAPSTTEAHEADDETLEDRIIRNFEMWGTLSKLARALDLDLHRDT